MRLIPKYQTGRGFIQANPEQARRQISRLSNREHRVNPNADNTPNRNSRRGGRTQDRIDREEREARQRIEERQRRERSSSNMGHYGSMGSFYNNGMGPDKETLREGVHEAGELIRDDVVSPVLGVVGEAVNGATRNNPIVGPVLQGLTLAKDPSLINNPTKWNEKQDEITNTAMQYATPSYYIRKIVPEEWQEDNPWLDLGFMAGDAYVMGKVIPGAKGKLKQRGLDVAYENITPMTYNGIPGLISRGKELRNAAIDFVNPFYRSNRSVNYIPKWSVRLAKQLERDPTLKTLETDGMTFPQSMVFRDEAWRLATKRPQRLNLYERNDNGTYRYNEDVVKAVKGSNEIMPDNTLNVSRSQHGNLTASDLITTNGGTVGIRMNTENPFFVNNGSTFYAERPVTMYDVWDLMPFQNEISSLWPRLTRWGKKFPKTVGKFTNMDLLKPFGGGFTLEHTTPMKVILTEENPWVSNILSPKVKPFNSWE